MAPLNNELADLSSHFNLKPHMWLMWLPVWRVQSHNIIIALWHLLHAAATAKSLQSCPTVQPHRWQPIRLLRPWDSPGKNNGVGIYYIENI